MKRLLCHPYIFFLFLLFPLRNNYSQPFISLQIDETKLSLNFGSLIMANGLNGAEVFFCVDIIPSAPDNPVSMEGRIEWQKPEGGDYELLASFITNPFRIYHFCNDQIGKADIRLANWESNSVVMEENRKRGKPTGRYRIAVRAFEETSSSEWSERIIELLNPTQSFVITSPSPGEEFDVGNVVAEWSFVPGATYEIRANVISFPNQSLEDALNSGTPLINNRNVGASTNVNLRNILEREWNPGDEIVMQVRAVTGGIERLFSEIVRFRLKDGSPSGDQATFGLISQLAALLGKGDISYSLEHEKFKILSSQRESGALLNNEDLIILLTSLLNDPSLLVNIEFNKR